MGDRGRRWMPGVLAAALQLIGASAGSAQQADAALIAEIDRQGILATPANSFINELVVEAARLSIQHDGQQTPPDSDLINHGHILMPFGPCDFIDAKNAHSVSLVKQCFQIETNKRLFALSACGSIQIRVQEQVFGKRTWE